MDRLLPGFENEAGVHRVQRVPPNERRGRVHSSAVTVSIIDSRKSTETHLPEQDLRYRWFSGTGSGGQHRNKHQNCLELTHVPTGLTRTAQTRSRANSLAEARSSLEAAVLDHARSKAAASTNDDRRRQTGDGGRAERFRLWRFRDDVVTDGPSGRSTSCTRAMRGGIDALWPEDQRLKR